MNSSTWRCRAVRSVMARPPTFQRARTGSGGVATPSETPSRTVTRSGVRGKHLFESGLDPERVFVVGCEQAFGPPSWISRVGRATPGSGLLPGAVVRRNCHTRVVRYGGRNRTGRGARSSERARTEPAGARRERERAKRERERAREREREGRRHVGWPPP